MCTKQGLLLTILKDLGTFCNTKHNVHRLTLNLHHLNMFEDDDSSRLTLKMLLAEVLVLVFRDEHYFCD